MSIIVKGMEMPKNCTRCDYIGLNAAIGCSVMSGTNGRATDCPLVALPEKHGRLVDVNEIIVSQEECDNIDSCQKCRMHVSCCTDMEDVLKNAQTIIEPEGES